MCVCFSPLWYLPISPNCKYSVLPVIIKFHPLLFVKLSVLLFLKLDSIHIYLTHSYLRSSASMAALYMAIIIS